jgi:hypothetical protein
MNEMNPSDRGTRERTRTGAVSARYDDEDELSPQIVAWMEQRDQLARRTRELVCVLEGNAMGRRERDLLQRRALTMIVELWRLGRPVRSVAATAFVGASVAPSQSGGRVRTPPLAYDRQKRRRCASNNQGSRKRRFSNCAARHHFYAIHRSTRFAAHMERPGRSPDPPA